MSIAELVAPADAGEGGDASEIAESFGITD
jgi:hypothetical protein